MGCSCFEVLIIQSLKVIEHFQHKKYTLNKNLVEKFLKWSAKHEKHK